MDREGDDSLSYSTLHRNYPGLNLPFDGRNNEKHGRILMVLCVAKDATTRRRHWWELPMTFIFGGGFLVVFPPKITDFESENKH